MRNISLKSDSDKYYSIDNEKPSLSFEIFKMNQELWRGNTQKIKSIRVRLSTVSYVYRKLSIDLFGTFFMLFAAKKRSNVVEQRDAARSDHRL